MAPSEVERLTIYQARLLCSSEEHIKGRIKLTLDEARELSEQRRGKKPPPELREAREQLRQLRKQFTGREDL